MNSTYSSGSHQITQVFHEAAIEKIIVVPLDFAKSSHLARLCLANGRYLHKKAITLRNDQDGVDYLIKRIEAACSRNGIQKKHVIIASENPHSYAKHFLHSLKNSGYAVVEVNAAYAKTLRKGNMASSDNLDLDGIANAVLNRRAKDLEELDKVYSALERSTRTYKTYTKNLAAQKNRIGKIIDELFPGFLDKKKSGIEAYSRVSIDLMNSGFSAPKVRRMKIATLTAKLKKFRIKNPAQTAEKFKKYASEVLQPAEFLIDSLSKSLENAINLYKALEQACQVELEQSAKLLVQTPYVTMLSIPGIGVVRAAVFAAELKDPSSWHTLDQTCAYAGIAPRSYQTGGADKPAVNIGITKKCNRRLKDALLQASHQTAMHAHPAGKFEPKFKEHRLRNHYKQVEARGGKSGLSTGRMILRIMRPMVQALSIYLPNHSHGKKDIQWEPDELALYVTSAFEKMDNNLKGFDFSSIKNNQLEKLKKDWRLVFKEIHNIKVGF